jgi:hypothetical protein
LKQGATLEWVPVSSTAAAAVTAGFPSRFLSVARSARMIFATLLRGGPGIFVIIDLVIVSGHEPAHNVALSIVSRFLQLSKHLSQIFCSLSQRLFRVSH